MTKKKESKITEELFAFRDEEYGKFQAKLIPTIDPKSIIGVRTPALRALAKEHIKAGDIDAFLSQLPHKYFDENQLHVMILSQLNDYGRCIDEVRSFLPYIDNWATCDQLNPRVFAKHKKELLKDIKIWIRSGDTYTVRFAAGLLLSLYLDDDFSPEYPKMVSKLRTGEYYIDMMTAWYFATALAKQYDAVIPYIEKNRLSVWVHNKTIQKAVESYRITDEQKTYLKSLKRKEK